MSDRRLVALGLFLFCLGLYALASGGHTYSSDEEGMLATTESLIEDADPVLSINPGNTGVTPQRIGRDGKVVGVSGMAQSIVAVPLSAAGRAFAAVAADEERREFTERVFTGWTNSFSTAVGVVLVFLCAELLGATRKRAAALALVYAFATWAWPHSKTFFSEPLATTLVLASVYYALRAAQSKRWRDVALSGMWIGWALSARSSTGLFVPFIGLYLIVALVGWPPDWRRLVRVVVWFGIGSAVPLAFLMFTNWWRFGDPFDLGASSLPLSFPIQEGLYGFFLSPGKSVFLYAPIVLVSAVALAWAPRERRRDVVFLVVLGLVNALFFARFIQWHGDHSWGPRYLTMSLPFFVLPVAAVMGSVRWRRAVAAAAVTGFAVNLLGVVVYFNQYFDIVHHSVPWVMEPEGPSYWKKMHFDPYWSPIAGHARMLPDIARNTMKRVDGEDAGIQEWPTTTSGRYVWYFGPPQADSWAYWVQPAHGPQKLWLFVPVWLAVSAAGTVVLRRGVTAPA